MSFKFRHLLVSFSLVVANLAVAQSVTISSPSNLSTVTSPVRVQASAVSPNRVRLMQVYVDGTKVYEIKAASLNTSLVMQAGSRRVTTRARDNRQWFESSVSITVSAPVTTLAITTATLPGTTAGTAYNTTLTASGGKPAYTWGLASGSLPPGLTLAATTGTISGIPTTIGTSSFTARVTDSGVPAQVVTKALAITVGSSAPSSSAPSPGANDVIIFQDDFETGTLNKWDQALYRYSLETDPAHVRSGSFSVRQRIDVGYNNGELSKWFMPGYDEIYVKMDVMFSPGFSDTGMHWLGIRGNRIDNKWSASGNAGIRPNGTDRFNTSIDPEYPSQNNGVLGLYPFQFYSYWPEMVCPSNYDPVTNPNCWGNSTLQTLPKVANTAGVWHQVVARVKMNTVGQHDGLQELWVDGSKKISKTGMRWRDTTDLRLNEITFSMYVAQAIQMQNIWVDNVVVWKPGP